MRITDALGNITTTTRSGYGSPEDGNPIRIDQPEGITTRMVYDIYGNLTSATQDGQTQSWTYDSQYRVCAHRTPETATTRYAYDAKGQVTQYAEGQASGCGGAATGTAIMQSYDSLGQMTARTYGDGVTPNVAFTYDDNGNLTAINRGSGPGAVNWAYAYDGADQLISETLSLDGRTYAMRYSHDANGYVTGSTRPGGEALAYTLDGFGQNLAMAVDNVSLASGGVTPMVAQA